MPAGGSEHLAIGGWIRIIFGGISFTNSKGSFRHAGENSRQCKVLFIMRSPYGNALPIKALFLLASLSASSTYV